MKTVLITGGARGIGKGCVIAFAQKGYNVAINYNNSQKEAKNLKNDILSNGLSAEIFKADVSCENEAKKLIDDVVARFGKIDVLINNAGKALYKPFDEVTDPEWQNLCACDLSSVVYCTKYAVKDMLLHKYGRIINISSMWGERGASCEAHYSAVKAGIIGLTKALAKEYAPCGITANCITPGVIDTDMLNIFSAQEKAELINRTPCARLGTPYDVAAAALFFADTRSDFITGQVLGVDGGFV